MITVIVGTCNRPAMLRDALESIRRQTARDSIGQVIVSENSTNHESNSVCAAFPDLPLEYVKQTPPIPAMFHLKAIWGQVRSSLVAFLHDDDWWAPQHLEAALGWLGARLDSPGVFSNFYESFGPKYPHMASPRLVALWVASECDFANLVLDLDAADVTLGCVFWANFHYSTLVGRTDAVWDAYLKVVASGNPADNDRTFPIFLSSHGQIGFLTTPDTFIRQHCEQDSKRPAYLARGRQRENQTTKEILASEPSNVARAAAKFNRIVGRFDARHLGILSPIMNACIVDPHRATLIRHCGFDLALLEPQVQAQLNPQRERLWLLKQFCPPGLLAVMRRLRRVRGAFRSVRTPPADVLTKDP